MFFSFSLAQIKDKKMASELVVRSELAIATSERIKARFKNVAKPESVVAIPKVVMVKESKMNNGNGSTEERDPSLYWNLRRLAAHSRKRSAKMKER